MPHYNFLENVVCDVVHDILLGVGRYDMAKIINYCVKQHYFTLEQLNDRLKYFDHSEYDRGNRVSSISGGHIQKGALIITATEM